jgi:hypothetical protein
VIRDDASASGPRPRTLRIDIIHTGGDLLSRAEARGLADGFRAFDRVELDFTGVEFIGQGFADELFRVWPARNRNVELVPLGASASVARMIVHVTRR